MNNDGHFKKIGGSKFIQTTITSSCKIKIDGESVYVDGEALSKAADVKSGDFDPDLHIMLSKISQHALDHEKWIITNVSDVRVTTGFCNHGSLRPGESIDALLLASRDEINSSSCIQGAKNRGLITIEIVKKD